MGSSCIADNRSENLMKKIYNGIAAVYIVLSSYTIQGRGRGDGEMR